MRARDLMSSPAVTVAADAPISEAGALLIERGFSAFPVLDQAKRLVGIVSEADLVRGRVGTDPTAHLRPVAEDPTEPPHLVRDVMTREVITVPITADEAEIASAMLTRRIKSVPVTADGELVGIVAASDLLRSHLRSDDDIGLEVAARLREYADGEDLWSVTVKDGVVTLAGTVTEPHRRIALLLAETVPGAVRVRMAGESGGGPAAAAPAAEPAKVSGPTDHRGLQVLGLDQCLERVRSVTTGRLAFIRDGEPNILPINHGLDKTDVVFRTSWGSKLTSAEDLGAVAFEVDGVDTEHRTGWSVLVKGTASVVYDNAEIERLETLGVQSWVPPHVIPYWVRIRAEEITGREIGVELSGRSSAAAVSGQG